MCAADARGDGLCIARSALVDAPLRSEERLAGQHVLIVGAGVCAIRRHLRVNTELTSSRWDESKRRGISTLKTKNGEGILEFTAPASAIGLLNDPARAHLTALRRQPAANRRELQPEAFRHRLVGDAAAMDVETVAQVRIFQHRGKTLAGEHQPERQRCIVQRLA